MPIATGTAMTQGERRRPHGAEYEGADVGPEVLGRAFDVVGIGDESREALGDEEEGDGGQDDEDQAAREGGRAAEDAVGRPLLGLDPCLS